MQIKINELKFIGQLQGLREFLGQVIQYFFLITFRNEVLNPSWNVRAHERYGQVCNIPRSWISQHNVTMKTEENSIALEQLILIQSLPFLCVFKFVIFKDLSLFVTTDSVLNLEKFFAAGT